MNSRNEVFKFQSESVEIETSENAHEAVRAGSSNERIAQQTTPSKWPPKRSFAVSPTKNIKRKRDHQGSIATFVFFDLETTTLVNKRRFYKYDHLTRSEQFTSQLSQMIIESQANDFPKITEMTFLAVPRETFIEHMNELSASAKKGIDIPIKQKVVGNIHSRLVNPNLTSAEWGLYEDHQRREPGILVHKKQQLLRCKTFKQEWPYVIDFLESCPKPACLVAHNAMFFDLRVLHWEIKAAGLIESHKIPDDVFFIDTLVMSRFIETKLLNELEMLTKSINWSKISVNQKPSNGENDGIHPLMFIDTHHWTVANERRIKSSFFKPRNDGKWELKPAKDELKHSLKELFTGILKQSFDAHHAFDDTIALVQVCLSYGQSFIDYIDTMSADVPF